MSRKKAAAGLALGVAVLTAALTGGCGGSKSATSSVVTPAGKGTVRVKVAWPQTKAAAAVSPATIPFGTTSIWVNAVQNSAVVATCVIVSPGTQGTLYDVPCGATVLVARAYTDAGGRMTMLGSGDTSITVRAGLNDAATVTIASSALAQMSLSDPAGDTGGPDYTDVTELNVSQVDAHTLLFTMQLAGPIPAGLTGYCAYIWGLDTDLNPSTGYADHDQGNDYHVRLFKDTNLDPDWHVAIDNMIGGPGTGPGIVVGVAGNMVAAEVDLDQIGNPTAMTVVAGTIPPTGQGDPVPNTNTHGSLTISPP